MHWQRSAISDQQQQPRPYQGVRVKEPVKELLKRKRGSINNTNATSAATVFLPHQTLSTYSTIDQSCIDMDIAATSLPIADEGSLYAGWISQPSPATLQPLSQWATCPEYMPHEAATYPYTADMYIQPVCPSYAVVGPSSVLTYTSQPLLTNFTPRNSPAAAMPPLELTEQQAPLTYFPWAQPVSALPTATLQYPSPANTLAGPQFVPLPISIPEPAAHDLEEARRVIGCVPIEKLLQEDEDNDTYVLNNALSIEGF
ncbi:POU domain class 2-associating factor 1 isoform X2 [Rhinatrema bivittatum]|uniref:POU domain class 2-associating factor 1 isoform X2 n=1 Tax=Rhinatrema bivittatum TaxID=194408 RepID=UPI00112D765B|nr:POU domain class 2-associating factor 1 isoform X2 [Rhinatrema bivittatum]